MNHYLIIGVIVAWLASLAGVGWWQNGAGHSAERDAWQRRENAELVAANQEIATLHEKARADGADHNARLTAISADYERKLSNAKTQRDRDVAAAHAGALRLRFDAASEGAGASAAGETGAGPGRCDGSTPGELPRALAADLLALVGDADAVAEQLAAAQKIIEEDRRLCGENVDQNVDQTALKHPKK